MVQQNMIELLVFYKKVSLCLLFLCYIFSLLIVLSSLHCNVIVYKGRMLLMNLCLEYIKFPDACRYLVNLLILHLIC